MNNNKTITASIDEIVEAIEGILKAHDCKIMIHKGIIRTALEGFVVEESTKKGGDDEGRYYCQEWDKVGFVCPEGQCDLCRKIEKGGEDE